MDKLERRLARLWRRIGGGRRRERRSKKDESPTSLGRDGNVLSDKKEKARSSTPPSRHRHQSDSAASKESARSRDLSRALVRLYAFARLRSLQSMIVAESTPTLNGSTTPDLSSLEFQRPMEKFSFLSSLPQLSIPRLKSHEFDKLVVTAWNVFDPSKNASRLLRVVVEDVDDIAPEFLKSGMMLFTAPHSTANSDVVVGKVSVANDKGPAPHYYLMPTCAEEIGHFSIDGRSGEISVSALAQSGHKAREEFCVFASSRDGVDVGDLAYDAKNASMIRAAVEFDAEQAPSAPLPGPENNTVTVIQENMRSAIIPVTSSDGTDRGIRYSLENVQFIPVQNSSAAVLTGGPSLFFVNPRTGETRANPALADQPQGIYTILINAAATNPIEPPRRLIRKFHYVKDEMKLRYVLNMAPEEFATKREQFSRRLQQALKVDHPEGSMEVFLAEPRRDNRNATRTTVCFHAVMNEQVQSEKSAILALSQPTVENSELSRLYHYFQVVNIERCEETLMALRQSAFQLPMQVLLLVAGVALLVLLLIALITYICFVQRYKEHLRMKQSQLKSLVSEGTPSPLSYSPTFILPPVGPRYGYY